MILISSHRFIWGVSKAAHCETLIPQSKESFALPQGGFTRSKSHLTRGVEQRAQPTLSTLSPLCKHSRATETNAPDLFGVRACLKCPLENKIINVYPFKALQLQSQLSPEPKHSKRPSGDSSSFPSSAFTPPSTESFVKH